jgi:triacylglycerol lipase
MPPIWRELAAWVAPAVPAPAPATGIGEPVLLVPGFLAGDSSLRPLNTYLARAGYRPCSADIRANAGCSEATLERLIARAEALAERQATRVAIVGHSRGGLLARALARRRPDLVSGFVTLGSPLRDHLAVHPIVWAHALGLATLGSLGVPGVLRLSCGTGRCCERFWRDLAAPLPPGVQSLAVCTRRDGIVDWRACVDPSGSTLEVVGTTHLGMVTHAPTLHAVAVAVSSFRAPERRARPAHALAA